ncbi:MAG: ROK family protein [Pseudomonadota bacterium]
MAILVADVGGTNARLALVDKTGLVQNSVRRFANHNFKSFYHVVDEYLISVCARDIEACSVAVAGIVSAQRAKLTNINWEISADGLKQTLSCDYTILMNDLTALGYSIDTLEGGDLTLISGSRTTTQNNGQSLVIGIGTGFNVCPVKQLADNRIMCMEAEYGHTKMPECILGASIFSQKNCKQWPNTVEDLLSGRGFSKLHSLHTQKTPLLASEIIEGCASGTDQFAEAALSDFARLLGLLTNQLVLKYLPMGGIYFSGSVARAVLGSSFASEFCMAFMSSCTFNTELQNIPVSIINDDFAPLKGCQVAIGAR